MGTAKYGWKVCQKGIRLARTLEEMPSIRPQINLRAIGCTPDESGWGGSPLERVLTFSQAIHRWA